MQILAMGVTSRRPVLVEFTDEEMTVKADYEAMFERTDNIILSAKVALRRYARRIGGLNGRHDDLIDHLSDGMLTRWGPFNLRVKGGRSTSAIGTRSGREF